MCAMLDRFEDMRARYEELEAALAKTDAATEPQYPGRLREFGRLTKFVAPYREYLETKEQVAEHEGLIAEDDEDLAELAEQELPELREKVTGLQAHLTALITQEDEKTDRDVIMEIRAGTGGEEAALFGGDLYRMYRRFLETHKFKVRPLDVSESEMGGFKEITFEVLGEGAYEVLRFEGGTHRVQRVPKTEAQGRIHTSAATVAVMPKAEDVDIQLDPGDLEISFMHSGGPGGQSVNTTDSCVRIVHKPTGEQVKCQVAKSQHQNRALAMDILRSRLLQRAQAEQEAKLGATRRSQIGSGDRSERIRTYNFPQNRVTDHRLTTDKNFSLQKIVDGELSDLLEKLKEQLARPRLIGDDEGE